MNFADRYRMVRNFNYKWCVQNQYGFMLVLPATIISAIGSGAATSTSGVGSEITDFAFMQVYNAAAVRRFLLAIGADLSSDSKMGMIRVETKDDEVIGYIPELCLTAAFISGASGGRWRTAHYDLEQYNDMPDQDVAKISGLVSSICSHPQYRTESFTVIADMLCVDYRKSQHGIFGAEISDRTAGVIDDIFNKRWVSVKFIESIFGVDVEYIRSPMYTADRICAVDFSTGYSGCLGTSGANRTHRSDAIILGSHVERTAWIHAKNGFLYSSISFPESKEFERECAIAKGRDINIEIDNGTFGDELEDDLSYRVSGIDFASETMRQIEMYHNITGSRPGLVDSMIKSFYAKVVKHRRHDRSRLSRELELLEQEIGNAEKNLQEMRETRIGLNENLSAVFMDKFKSRLKTGINDLIKNRKRLKVCSVSQQPGHGDTYLFVMDPVFVEADSKFYRSPIWSFSLSARKGWSMCSVGSVDMHGSCLGVNTGSVVTSAGVIKAFETTDFTSWIRSLRQSWSKYIVEKVAILSSDDSLESYGFTEVDAATYYQNM